MILNYMMEFVLLFKQPSTLRELMKSSAIDKLDNRVLLSFITGFSHAQLIARDDYQLTDAQFQQYQDLLQRASGGEPIAYIIGYKEFYSRQFKVTPATLIPRPETELLVEQVLQLAPQNAKIIDLGTGSGCIAISCKLERPDLQVSAVDKFDDALNIARQNAERLQAQIEFTQSDWLAKIYDEFDVVVSNPPYIEVNDSHLQNLQFEPQIALTDFDDGLSCIKIIVQQAIMKLKYNGWLLIEHGYNQGTDVRTIFKNKGFKDIETIKDYADLERITIGQKINN